jgi:hypothetical protein
MRRGAVGAACSRENKVNFPAAAACSRENKLNFPAGAPCSAGNKLNFPVGAPCYHGNKVNFPAGAPCSHRNKLNFPAGAPYSAGNKVPKWEEKAGSAADSLRNSLYLLPYPPKGGFMPNSSHGDGPWGQGEGL